MSFNFAPLTVLILLALAFSHLSTRAWAGEELRRTAIEKPVLIGLAPRVVIRSGTVIMPIEGKAKGFSLGDLWSGLTGGAKAKQITIAHPLIEVELPKAASEGPALSPEKQLKNTVLWTLLRLPYGAINIEDATITIRHSGEAGPAMELTNASLQIARGEDNGALTVKGVAEWRRKRVEVTLRIGRESKVEKQISVPLAGRLRSHDMELDFDGTLAVAQSIAMQGAVVLRAKSLRTTMAWLGQNVPGAHGFADFRASGRFRWSKNSISLSDATFMLDGNEAEGALSLSYKGRRPVIDGTLAFNDADLSVYFGLKEDTEHTAFLGAIFTDRPVPVPQLNVVNADLRVSASSIKLGGQSVGRTALSFSLRNGQMLADIAEMELQGGVLGGQLSITKKGNVAQIAIRGSIENFLLGECLHKLWGVRPLSGRASLGVEFMSASDTYAGLLENLDGWVSLDLKNGGKARLNLPKILKAAEEKDLRGWHDVAQGETSFDKLKAKFALKGGSAYSEAFVVTTGAGKMTGDGTINLHARQIYARLYLPQAGGAGAKGAKAGRTRSIVVRGSWDHPEIHLEPLSPATASSGSDGEAGASDGSTARPKGGGG